MDPVEAERERICALLEEQARQAEQPGDAVLAGLLTAKDNFQALKRVVGGLLGYRQGYRQVGDAIVATYRIATTTAYRRAVDEIRNGARES